MVKSDYLNKICRIGIVVENKRKLIKGRIVGRSVNGPRSTYDVETQYGKITIPTEWCTINKRDQEGRHDISVDPKGWRSISQEMA